MPTLPLKPKPLTPVQLQGLDAASMRKAMGTANPADLKNLDFATRTAGYTYKPSIPAPVPITPPSVASAPVQPTPVAPITTPTPASTPAITGGLTPEEVTKRAALRTALSSASNLSPDEVSLQNSLTDLQGNTRLGVSALEGQGRGIPLQLVRGQQGKLQEQGNIQEQTILQRLANAQAARQMAEQKAKLDLDLFEKDVSDRQEQLKPITLGSGSSLARYNPTTGKYDITQAPETDGFTLSAGQTRYGADGKPIASAGTPTASEIKQDNDMALKGYQYISGPDQLKGLSENDIVRLKDASGKERIYAKPDKILTPAEAKKLGVPYGTTQRQAASGGRNVSTPSSSGRNVSESPGDGTVSQPASVALNKLLTNYPADFKTYIKSISPTANFKLDEKNIATQYQQFVEMKGKGILPYGQVVKDPAKVWQWLASDDAKGLTPAQKKQEIMNNGFNPKTFGLE